MICILKNMIKLRYCHNVWVVGGLCGYGGSVWVMGEWAVGQKVDITSLQKIQYVTVALCNAGSFVTLAPWL